MRRRPSNEFTDNDNIDKDTSSKRVIEDPIEEPQQKKSNEDIVMEILMKRPSRRKILVSYSSNVNLNERKEEVNNLSTKRGGGGNTKAKPWQDAYKDDMDHNKQSGNDPVEVRYKTEVEEILPSLTPKMLDNSLNLGNLDNEEVAAPFDEITGRNKRKNESEFNQEEAHKKLISLMFDRSRIY
ncbi:hypothetical protein C1645_820019 [Glomus cerebriforme]|uniref:Uncharacterized protein n=1 Tax=Glomus cerebriforme TaxID=658196 RepID=A0A397T9I6_9GLOM|nr:hypothetical protein C1645_820019 [Glomus cerebriforme]